MKNTFLFIAILFAFIFSCTTQDRFNPQPELDYCDQQIYKTLEQIGDTTMLPINIMDSLTGWHLMSIHAWTSGFWPGILWYDYENTRDEKIKQHAVHYTGLLEPLSRKKIGDHDLGFQIMSSYGNAYRLTKEEKYKEVMLRAADTLATLYNPVVGTILSWPGMRKKMDWPHNTIIDNMMNLELLIWASKNGGSKKLYDIATRHADVTMKYHFRPDGSAYHVAVYDTISGNFIKGVTHQGYADETMWARGQAWGIYGFTFMYRETQNKDYLRFAEKITDVYLKRLPEDYIPYWDFDAPGIPDEPRDASAAAIVASALLELSQVEDNKQKSEEYKNAAIRMLEELSTARYQSCNSKPSFLLHSTGHWPQRREVDASIIYADYYYIEALTRLKNINKPK